MSVPKRKISLLGGSFELDWKYTIRSLVKSSSNKGQGHDRVNHSRGLIYDAFRVFIILRCHSCAVSALSICNDAAFFVLFIALYGSYFKKKNYSSYLLNGISNNYGVLICARLRAIQMRLVRYRFPVTVRWWRRRLKII